MSPPAPPPPLNVLDDVPPPPAPPPATIKISTPVSAEVVVKVPLVVKVCKTTLFVGASKYVIVPPDASTFPTTVTDRVPETIAESFVAFTCTFPEVIPVSPESVKPAANCVCVQEPYFVVPMKMSIVVDEPGSEEVPCTVIDTEVAEALERVILGSEYV